MRCNGMAGVSDVVWIGIPNRLSTGVRALIKAGVQERGLGLQSELGIVQ